MKTMLALLIVSTLTACSGIQTVSDVLATIEAKKSECYGAVDRLAAKGVTLPGVDKAACDKAAAKIEGSLSDILAKLREALTKAGV